MSDARSTVGVEWWGVAAAQRLECFEIGTFCDIRTPLHHNLRH
jgi:hypothetical protein